jgi:hypothetical protein
MVTFLSVNGRNLCGSCYTITMLKKVFLRIGSQSHIAYKKKPGAKAGLQSSSVLRVRRALV